MSARHAGRRRGGETARKKERKREGRKEGRKRGENKKFECDAGEEKDDGNRRESVTFVLRTMRLNTEPPEESQPL